MILEVVLSGGGNRCWMVLMLLCQVSVIILVLWKVKGNVGIVGVLKGVEKLFVSNCFSVSLFVVWIF